jgi:diaminopimelate decarboxylase
MTITPNHATSSESPSTYFARVRIERFGLGERSDRPPLARSELAKSSAISSLRARLGRSNDAAVIEHDGPLTVGGISAAALAERLGTPLYAYDVGAMRAEAAALDEAFEDAAHLVAYAVKANTAGPVIAAFARAGCGADVVSGGELEVALASGMPPDRILYSGVAKQEHEIRRALACGDRGILALHIESIEEIERVAAVARSLGRPARVGLRINPEMEEVRTHAHVSTGHDEAKFGIAQADLADALAYVRARPELDLGGLTVHVGSQLVTTDDYRAGARRLFEIARALPERASFRFLDTGGGFGVDYGAGCRATPADFVRAAREEQRAAGLDGIALFVEPGRRLVASHGVLLTRVIQTKKASPLPWVFVDAGMNDLLRPALYQARHRVVPAAPAHGPVQRCRVAGPVCESADDFGIHELPDDATLLAFRDAGAYGFTMASQYNGRALPAEVFVDEGRVVAELPRGDVGAWVRGRCGERTR